MSQKKHSRRTSRPVSASALCELLRQQLPFPTSSYYKASDEALQLERTNLHLTRASRLLKGDSPLHQTQTNKWSEKWAVAAQVLEDLHHEIFALSPLDPLMKPSPEEEKRRSELLRRVDAAIFEYVALDKQGLFSEPIIKARISVATIFANREFFEGLALAVRRRVGWHGRIRRPILIRAAIMLEQGMSWMQVYDALVKLWETDPETEQVHPRDREVYEALNKTWGMDDLPKPEAFYKQLKRHGLIRRRWTPTAYRDTVKEFLDEETE